MSWLKKLLPPKIKRDTPSGRKAIPEGLWSKCPACEAVLYRSDLESNLNVCPKCGHHQRIRARQRIDLLLDPEGRFEIGAEVVPVDPLKFKDSKRYPDRLAAANEDTGEADALLVVQGAIKTVPVVVACFEFEFLGGSMGSVVGERFLRGGGIEQLVGEAGQKAIARAHGVGHFYAKAAVVVNLAFLIIHGAVAAEGNADFGRAAQIGQKADVLLERMVFGAERAGDFMQLVIIELHQVG